MISAHCLAWRLVQDSADLAIDNQSSDQPLGRGLFRGARGQLKFQVLRGILPGGVEVKPLNGVVRSNGPDLTFENLNGNVGGGEAKGDISARASNDGMTIDARVKLNNAEGASLNYRGLALPEGRTSLQMVLATRGRSAGALAGALSGSGTLSVDNARLSGVNPRAFEAAVQTSDAGQIADDRKLQEIVTGALQAGSLAVSPFQIPFGIRDGNLRVAPTALDADSARIIVSGGYDVMADQVDIRASLTSTKIGSDSSRPEIQIFAHGSPGHLSRSIDVSSLSSWLAVRAIDRETRRLDSLERGEPITPPQQPAPAPPTAAAIPAPAEHVAPLSGVPIPGRDPRKRDKAKAIMPPGTSATVPTTAPALAPQAPPQASIVGVPDAVAPPLPPPIDVRPPPGAERPSRQRTPLILTPPAQN